MGRLLVRQLALHSRAVCRGKELAEHHTGYAQSKCRMTVTTADRHLHLILDIKDTQEPI